MATTVYEREICVAVVDFQVPVNFRSRDFQTGIFPTIEHTLTGLTSNPLSSHDICFLPKAS